MLVGRDAERARMDALLQRARDDRSAVLVVRGEPGIGKTALLEYAAERAEGMKVLRCVGIEAEHELPFAGMHQLVRPCLGLIDRLPPPQAAALRGALGLSAEPVVDRFLVSLGLLSLLAEACEERPTLCVVDDAQWLDRPSVEALTFAARRLDAERLALVIAAREDEPSSFDPPGLPELRLGSLDAEDARALLQARLDQGASVGVVDMLLDAAAGNPLALLELPAELSSEQLRGVDPIVGPPPVRASVERAFRTRVDALPESTAAVLLIAAAEDGGDPSAIERAAERLSLDAAAELARAERARLVRVDGAVAFRHPLIRSAVYHGASRAQRRAVHEALARAVADPLRAVWHRALVVDDADEAIAAQLESVAEQAVSRGAHASASIAFERAAELSADGAHRGHRLQRAAQASVDAGRAAAALALVDRARPFVHGPMDEAGLDLVGAAVVGRRGSPNDAYTLVVEAAAKLAGAAPEVALELLLWSVAAGYQGGWAARILGETRARIDRIAAGAQEMRFARLFLDGSQALLEGDPRAAREQLAAALELAERARTHGSRGAGPLLLHSVFICMSLGDLAQARAIAGGVLAQTRAQGGVIVLVELLPLCALAEVLAGRTRDAATLVDEGLEIAEQLGFDNDRTGLLAIRARIAAREGLQDECRRDAAAVIHAGTANAIGWAIAGARIALAELELSLGDPVAAIEQLEQLELGPILPQALLATPDFVDAALRAGTPARAGGALERFAAWAQASAEPVVPGLLLRCQAMLAEDPDEAERLFLAALDHGAEGAPVFERARTRLAFGERLRRDRRRVDARGHLRAALEAFEGLGATLWAERARGELRASGVTARKRDESTRDDLTPQELRIAQLVAGGSSNRDVAGRLFVSPKTVEYHLGKVFLKLGVQSRVELASMFYAQTG